MLRVRLVSALFICAAAASPASAQLTIRVHNGPAGSQGTFGSTGAAVGDVDHDGVEDYAIGAPYANPSHGEVRVFSGATGSLLYMVAGSGADSALGTWIDGAGDVNLDGTVDLLLGAMNLAVDPNDVRVISGSTHLMLWGKSGSQIGGGVSTVCSGGDLNGDGVPEVLATTFISFVGHKVVILNGSNGAPGASFGTGIVSYGLALDGGVDLNGDGVSEVLIGSPTESSVGRVYLYDGATRTELWHQAGTVVNGEFGAEVSLGADVNGDGFGDVAVLAARDDDSNNPVLVQGAVRVLSGATGGTVWTRFGHAKEALDDATIDFSHDLNGDGIGDVLVGAPREKKDGGWPNFDGTGRIYSGASGETRSLVAEPQVYPLEIGTTAFSVGDLSGDGLADFVLGGGGNGEGGARVYQSIPNGGTVTYAGGPAPGTPAGCTGKVGLQCDLEVPLLPCTLEAEGCFSPGGQAMLFAFSGLNSQSSLLFIGVQPITVVLPGGCSLLTNPLQTIVPYFQSGNPLDLPLSSPTGTAYLQLLSYVAAPFPYNCLQVSSSARVQITIQ